MSLKQACVKTFVWTNSFLSCRTRNRYRVEPSGHRVVNEDERTYKLKSNSAFLCRAYLNIEIDPTTCWSPGILVQATLGQYLHTLVWRHPGPVEGKSENRNLKL